MAIRKIWMVSCIDIDQIQNGAGRNHGVRFVRTMIPSEFFMEERHAQAEANRLARENPMKPYAVMSVDQVMETGNAPVINKKFNNEGELILA
jgi:hypothetical protein